MPDEWLQNRVEEFEQRNALFPGKPYYERWEEATVTEQDGLTSVSAFTGGNGARFTAILLVVFGFLWIGVQTKVMSGPFGFNWITAIRLSPLILLPCVVLFLWAFRREKLSSDGQTIRLQRTFQSDIRFDVQKGAYLYFGMLPMPGLLGDEARMWMIQGSDCHPWGLGLTLRERERVWQQIKPSFPQIIKEDVQQQLVSGDLCNLTMRYTCEMDQGMLIIKPKARLGYGVMGWWALAAGSFVMAINLVIASIVQIGNVALPLVVLLAIAWHGIRRRPSDMQIVVGLEDISYPKGSGRRSVSLKLVTDLQALTLKNSNPNAAQSMVAFRESLMPVVLVKDVTRSEAEALVEAINEATHGVIRRTGAGL